MTNEQMPKLKKFDLEERTAKFGEDIIEFAKEIPKTVITIPLIEQLIGIVEYPVCAYCNKPIFGSFTSGEKSALCFDCENKKR